MKDMTVSPKLGRTAMQVCSLLLFFAVANPASAHHSYAAFDMLNPVETVGVVKMFKWKNPHALLIITVTGADGEVTDHAFSLDGPAYLVRNGWTRKTISKGDKVTVIGAPRRDGKPAGALFDLIQADGTKLSGRAALQEDYRDKEGEQ